MILFTLQQAEAMIPQVRDELIAMQRCKRELDAVRAELMAVGRTPANNGHVKDEHALGEKRRQAEALVERLNAGLARLNGWGSSSKISIKG